MPQDFFSIVCGTQLDGSEDDADALDEETVESLGGHEEGAFDDAPPRLTLDSDESDMPIAISLSLPRPEVRDRIETDGTLSVGSHSDVTSDTTPSSTASLFM